MKSGKVVLGILAGVAAGALLGILFAPEKGSKTRRQILRRSEDYKDDVKEKFDEFLNSITEKFTKAQHNGEDMLAKGKAKYDEAKREVKNSTA